MEVQDGQLRNLVKNDLHRFIHWRRIGISWPPYGVLQKACSEVNVLRQFALESLASFIAIQVFLMFVVGDRYAILPRSH
jgi:hypothetical protein